MRKIILMMMALLLVGTSFVFARNGHGTRIGFAVGISENFEMISEVEPLGPDVAKVSGGGVLTDFAFGKRFGYHWWGHLDLSVNALDLDAQSAAWGSESSTLALIQLMLGVRNYPFGDASGFRPFAEANVGPVWGIESKSQSTVFTQSASSRSQMAFGAHVGGGVDLQLFSWMAFEAKAGYLFMNKFEEPFRGADQFEGWDFLFGLNFSWGSY